MSGELEDATIARWWHRQAERQGLPDQLTSAELARVVALAFASRDGHEGPA